MWAPFCDIFSPRAQEEKRRLELGEEQPTMENTSINKLNKHIRRCVVGIIFIMSLVVISAFLLKFTSIAILSFLVAMAYFIGYCLEG